MLVSAVTSLSYVSTYFEEWIEAEALIIGRNVTVHYRNSTESRRRLISSNIPNFTAEDIGGNETDLLGDAILNATDNDNNNTGGGLGNLDTWNDLGNTTDTEGNRTDNTDTNGDNMTGDWNNAGTSIGSTPAPTPIPPVIDDVGPGGRLVYCAEVRFQINDNITITAVSDTYCSYDPEDIVVGRAFIILYNPEMPTEIIEESLYEHAQNTLRLTVGVTIFFTVGYLLCSIYLWRSQPDLTRSIFPHTGHDFDFPDAHANEITQTPEEREAIMRTMFHFQTVLEDLSNTDAATIRRLCLKGEEEGECEKCHNEACCNNNNNNNKSCKEDTDEKIQPQDDIEAQQQANDPLQQPSSDEESDLELDLTKKETRDENSTCNTETETDTDAGSNNQGSASTEANDAKQPQQESHHDQEPTWSLAGATNIISSWTNAALTPSAPECCICLETYQPGDIICTSKKDGCDHVFHQHCIEAWLHRHDACPLCRVDLMNSEE